MQTSTRPSIAISDNLQRALKAWQLQLGITSIESAQQQEQQQSGVDIFQIKRSAWS